MTRKNDLTKNKSENELNNIEKTPWKQILNAQNELFISLDCIKEMISLILPILKDKDTERKKKLKEFVAKGTKKISYEKFDELKEIISRLATASEIYRQSVVTSIITKFDEFYTKLLFVCIGNNPEWINTSEKKLTYNEILRIKDINDFKSTILNEEVESLMRDSHYNQIEYLDKKLKLGIFNEFPDINKFIELTERRNLYVHTSGKVSNIYICNCKKWNIPLDEDCKEGILLSSNEEYIYQAIDCLIELSIRLSQSIIRRCFEEYKEVDSDLINAGADIIARGNNALGEKIFDFALSIPEKFIENDSKYYFVINKALSQKNQKKDFHETIKNYYWKSLSPKFQFAIYVLQDDFQNAYKLMKQELVYEEIQALGFKKWPLLKEIRNTKEFKAIYKSIFKKDISEEIQIEDSKKRKK